MKDQEKQNQINQIAQALCSEYPYGCKDCWSAPEKDHEDCCSVESDAEKLYDAGCRMLVSNVDFVVRASDLVDIREKAVKDTTEAFYSRLNDVQQVCEGNVRDNINKDKNEAQITLLEQIKAMLRRDFGTTVNRWAASKKDLKAIVSSACNKEGIAKHCPERIVEALSQAGIVSVEVLDKFVENLKTNLIGEHFEVDEDVDWYAHIYSLDEIIDVLYDTLKEFLKNER